MSDPAGGATSLCVERAPAKLNLTLEVRGRRADGYHELASLVAFADLGEHVTLTPADATSLSLTGPEAASLSGRDNLVLAADRAFRERFPGRVGPIAYRLDKRIPVAAGLGGGSADAAAALRGLAGLASIDPTSPELRDVALRLGADVPACLRSRAALMAGIGETVHDLGFAPPFAAVLVNPRVAVATADVFAALGLAPGWARDGLPAADPPRSAGDLREAVLAGRNDLEPAARRIAPDVVAIVDSLAATAGCLAARMSGSGATCFGLYDDPETARRAEARIAVRHREWWACAVALA